MLQQPKIKAIILAGGLGTRLRSAVPDLPKCMAPVNGKPFLHYVIKSLYNQGIESFVFSLGYKSQDIIDYINTEFKNISIEYVIENEPLGTGGAIALACENLNVENVIVTNGDTLFEVDILSLLEVHNANNSECTLALKPMVNFDRYGVVEISETQQIQSFQEKKYYESGLINGGMYILNIASFKNKALPKKFSFEKDYLEANYAISPMFGCPQNGYFIDIGIPIDYTKAQAEFAEKFV